MFRFGCIAGALAAILAPLCAQAAALTLSTTYTQLVPLQAYQFTVSGAAGTVTWQVNNANGGAAAAGTITSTGLYTAPATLPSPASVTITAIAAASSATATVTLLPQHPAGATYYVAKTGNDGNNGASSAPFLTIQHAMDKAQPGDTVLVESGIYNETVTPPYSGNASSGYITLSAAPGQTPIIDGADLPIKNNQWGLITLQNASYLIVQGFELRNYTTATTKDVPIGIYVFGGGSNIHLINNHIHDITTTAKTSAAACKSNALGMAIYGSGNPTPISALTISGNELNNLLTGCSESMSIDGNVDGFAVTSNLVHDNDNIGIDAIGFEKVSKDAALDQARNGEIRGNIVYNITSYGNPDYGKQYASDGIYVDGGTQITIEQNLVHDVDLGIELASEHKDHVTSYIIARNNVIYHDNSNGISIGGYGAGRGGTDHVTIVNNTLWDNDTQNTGSGEFQIQHNATNNIFENNIVYASSQALMVNDLTDDSTMQATLNDNLYFSPLGEAKSIWRWEKKKYKGFAAYLRLQQDAASTFADPGFRSTATPPNLDVTSPTKGADLGAATLGSVDFTGAPRNTGGAITIGAYQQ